jgi:murein L,D-transpeptidase YcbB/YkuD
MRNVSIWSASASLLALTLTLSSALAQAPVTATAAVSTDADPLTPPPKDDVAPIAPGVPAAAATALAKPASESHPAITALLAKLVTASNPDHAAIDAFYTTNGGQPIWTAASGVLPRGASAIAELARAADYGLDSTEAYKVPAQPLNFASPAAQADYELALTQAVLTYAKHARGGRLNPSKISASIDMKPRPYEPKSVLLGIAATDDAGAALRRFHPQHPGFNRLQAAYATARAQNSSAETLQRIQINLERWRWMPDDLGDFHVWNNVPEQLTRVVKNGEIVFTERIVVGKPGHSTPVMSADMQFVIFHPSWGVPAGIKSNEIGPMLKRASAANDSFFGESGRASAALGRHELKVSLNGRAINPDSVDWRAVDIRQFHFTQPPSGKNVLGVVKFRFPNKYDVYMHDTQERHLFSQSVRAYSHGCMRVQNPLNLAATILGHDQGWTLEKVQSHVKGGRSADITLKTPVPVHLTYFTVSADDAGKITTYGDIYGMDGRIASALLKAPVQLASARVTEQTSPRRAASRSRPTNAGTQTQAFNPFSGLFGN